VDKKQTAVKGIKWEDQTVTLTLTQDELRAIRSAIFWAEELEKAGKLELFEYQKETYEMLKGL
jgi:hypothetical protein